MYTYKESRVLIRIYFRIYRNAYDPFELHKICIKIYELISGLLEFIIVRCISGMLPLQLSQLTLFETVETWCVLKFFIYIHTYICTYDYI